MCQSCWCRDVCQPEWIFIQHLAHDGVNFLSWLVLGHPRSHYVVRLFHSVNGAVISWKWEFWLAAAPAHISLHLSCLQTPLPFCFALMRAHTQQLPTGRQRCYCCTSAPFFPIPVHCGIVAGVVIATVMQWPPSWNRFRFYLLGGRSRSDIPEEKGGLIFFFFREKVCHP